MSFSGFFPRIFLVFRLFSEDSQCWHWRFYLTNHFAWKLPRMKNQGMDLGILSREVPTILSEEPAKGARIIHNSNHGSFGVPPSKVGNFTPEQSDSRFNHSWVTWQSRPHVLLGYLSFPNSCCSWRFPFQTWQGSQGQRVSWLFSNKTQLP